MVINMMARWAEGIDESVARLKASAVLDNRLIGRLD
jgi:hypothetical protein